MPSPALHIHEPMIEFRLLFPPKARLISIKFDQQQFSMR